MKTTKRQRAALSEISYDLFGGEFPVITSDPIQPLPSSLTENEQTGLLTEEELYLLYDRFNRDYFNDSLPHVKISYSNRMLNAGQYNPSKREIKIGRKYHQIFTAEIEDTLKHEMIHLVHFNHSRKFKEMAQKIGATVKAKAHPDLRRKYKYLYICPSCGKEYPRRKRLRLAFCGSCCKNRNFRPEYKLKLIDSPAKKKQN